MRDDRALLSFFNAAVEEQGGRRELVVDLRRCEVVSTFAVKGITTELVGTSDGWVQFSSPDELQSGRFRFSILDEKGKVVDELDVDRPLAQLVKEKKYKAPLGPYDMRPFVLGKEVWGIPSGVYELWRPPQHGKPFRRVAPPNCLAAQGQELTGQENVQHVLELSKNWPDEVRESIERGAKHGGLAPEPHQSMGPVRGCAGSGLESDRRRACRRVEHGHGVHCRCRRDTGHCKPSRIQRLWPVAQGGRGAARTTASPGPLA